MENRFYNRDFEDFIKRNADQYRMFPSEKVWKNIHHNLHTRRRWYAIGVTLLLLTMGTVTWVMLSNSSGNSATAFSDRFVTTKNSNPESKTGSPIAFQKQVAKKVVNGSRFISNPENLQSRIFLNNSTVPDDAAGFNGQFSEPENIAVLNEPVIKPDKTAVPVIKTETIKTSIAYHKPATAVKPVSPSPVITSDNHIELSYTQTKPAISEAANSDASTTSGSSAEKKETFPLTIESVVNAYQYHKPKKRLSWEVFFTPTVTYRKLSENKDFIASAQSRANNLNYTAYTDVNNLVTHKPDIGLQFGVTAGYPLFKNVKLISGLQFNVSKYDIRAYYSSSEVATIALNTGGGANSVSTATNYRNFNGTDVDWLRNLYFSASAPIGLELNLPGKSKTRFGVRGTVQPTYILGDQAYLLTTDYKNYAEVPSLIRKFNINTGVELFATYSTGKIKWKFGPQARYQARSSFKAPYPVKEHLFDFGLKLGVMLR